MFDLSRLLVKGSKWNLFGAAKYPGNDALKLFALCSQVVSELAFFSDDPSLNRTEVCKSIICKMLLEMNERKVDCELSK